MPFEIQIQEASVAPVPPDCSAMGLKIEKISAITLKVASMEGAVRFYRDVLGMELLYGGARWSIFLSPHA
jgi:catechol-2,3-dioxygenase